jgi:uncharacterized membrane protein
MGTRLSEQAIEAGYAPPATVESSTRTSRIQSLDLMRGVVMVLMAIDHVRVYSGVPAGGQTAGVFFTRWITHFCAPSFVFLAGTAAFFHGSKLGDRRALTRFLVTRGAMLVALELTVIKFGWTFGLDYSFTLAGVIWMLGWCMILLGGLVRLQPRTLWWLGLGIVGLQQIFGLIPRALPSAAQAAIAPLWNFIYPSGAEGWEAVSILYVIVPWIGVMAAGYGFGLIIERHLERNDRALVRMGVGLTALFLAAASALAMTGDGDGPFYVRVLNQQKYPASQLFLLMTLGPVIALLPWAERARGGFSSAMTTIGRVPLFYYLLHIPLIHVSALAVNAIRTGAAHQEWYATAPYAQVPEEQRWPLALLYLVFAIDVVLLYFACRWYARLKAERPRPWMRYA